MNCSFGSNVSNCNIFFSGNHLHNGNMYVTFQLSSNWNGRTLLPKQLKNAHSCFMPTNYNSDCFVIPPYVTNASFMFYKSLQKSMNVIFNSDVKNLDCDSMFSQCNVNEISLKGTASINGYKMFSYSNVRKVSIDHYITFSTAAHMFDDCSVYNADNISDLFYFSSNWAFSFYNCVNLNQPIKLPTSINNVAGMFAYCTNLCQKIDLSAFSDNFNFYYMFGEEDINFTYNADRSRILCVKFPANWNYLYGGDNLYQNPFIFGSYFYPQSILHDWSDRGGGDDNRPYLSLNFDVPRVKIGWCGDIAVFCETNRSRLLFPNDTMQTWQGYSNTPYTTRNLNGGYVFLHNSKGQPQLLGVGPYSYIKEHFGY